MFLKGLILVLTAWFLGSFLWVALQRLSYPFELAIGEASVIEAVFRIIDGETLYNQPTLGWFPISHTPLYYYLSAILVHFLGASVSILRILTIGSTIGIGLILYRFLRRTGIDDFFALAGFGLFFAAYSSLNECYDLAAIDMLAVFLSLVAIYLSGLNRKILTVYLCAVITILAVFTDQMYLIVWALLSIHWFFQGRKQFYIYMILTTILILTGLFTLHLLNNGESWYCLFNMPFQKDLHFIKLLSFWFVDLFWIFPLMSVTAVIALFGLGRIFYRKSFKQSDMSMSVMVLGFFAVSLVTIIHEPGLKPAIVPALIALAGLTAWTLQHFHLNEYGFGWLPAVVAKTLVIIQFILLIYNPQPMIPRANDIESGKGLINFIAGVKGDALIPNHPYYTRLAGKNPHLSGELLKKFIKIENNGITGMPAEIIEAVSLKSFSIIIIDDPIDYWIDVISPYYLNEGKYFEGGEVFFTRSGRKIRPQYIYSPQ